MPQPLVSIVVPAYNASTYIKSTIESLLAQDYPHLEILVMNDGSTDNTLEVVQAYQDRLRILSHENCGQPATLNKGWTLAKGHYLGYLSADDNLMPTAISQLVDILENHPNAIVAYPDNELIDAKSRHIRNLYLTTFDRLSVLRTAMLPIAVGALFTRGAFEKSEGWNTDYHLVSDIDFWLRLSEYGEFIHLPQILGQHRVHPNSISFAATTDERADEYKNMVSELIHSSSDPLIAECKQQILARSYLISGRYHWRSGRYLKGAQYFLNNFFISPASIFQLSTLKIIINALLNKPIHRALAICRNFLSSTPSS